MQPSVKLIILMELWGQARLSHSTFNYSLCLRDGTRKKEVFHSKTFNTRTTAAAAGLGWLLMIVSQGKYLRTIIVGNLFIGLFPNPVTGDRQETNNQNNHQQIVSFLKPKFIAFFMVLLLAFVRIGWSYMEYSCLHKWELCNVCQFGNEQTLQLLWGDQTFRPVLQFSSSFDMTSPLHQRIIGNFLLHFIFKCPCCWNTWYYYSNLPCTIKFLN